MAGYFDLRLDYVYFLHGIALALLASAAWGLSRLENQRNWTWLGLFAAAQAGYVWLKIVSFDAGDSPALLTLRSGLLVGSFFCLVEFARRKLRSMGKLVLSYWLHLVPVAVTFIGVLCGGPELLAWTFPACGSLGGLLAAAAFLMERPITPNADDPRRLKFFGAALGLYSVAMGFFAERYLLQHASRAGVSDEKQFPWLLAAELTCAILGAISCCIFGLHYSLGHHARLSKQGARPWSRKRTIQFSVLIFAAASGWFASEEAVQSHDASMRREVLLRTNLIAAAITPHHVATLQWGNEDLTNPCYQELKARMMALVQANKDLRFVMLTGFNEGKAYFLVDSEKPDSADYSPPGQLYAEADKEYLDAINTHHPFVLGPIADRWGTWVSASVPLGEFGPNKRWITADIDIQASSWNSLLRKARLPVVLITLLIALLLLTFVHAQERIQESLAGLSASEQCNSSLVEGSPNCVQLFGPDGCCQAINQNGLQALGRATRGEIIGRTFADLWPNQSQSTVRNAVSQTLKGQGNMFEAEYVRPDGRMIVWRVALAPVRDASNVVRSFVAISVDISNFKSSEKALLAAKETAETATKAKSEFLAVMSHEIRTPLGGVIGMLNILLKHPMSAEQQLYTELAHENAENLLGILDDVLDSAKVEAGKLTIETIPFDPAVEFGRVFEPMRVRAEAKALNLTWTLAPGMPKVLLGDPTRLRQVLANLLSNALKFTESGSITTVISTDHSATGKLTLRISVSDTGIGIRPERLSQLFNRFEQADASTTRRFGGTGLGLSIVKSLAELMAGNISAVSTLGKGTTFTFTASLGEGSARDIPSDNRRPAGSTVLPRHHARLHVLCAEDDVTNQVAAEFLVKQMGHTIEFVENGKLAVEWLSRHRAAVVLMDNRMPVMDGFQATETIRNPQSGVIDHQIYIIANTANAASGYHERCLAAGMNDYLTKPLREAELHAALERAIAICLERGATLPPMLDEKRTHLVHAVPPPIHQPELNGLSEEELLAILDQDAAAKPADPTANLPPEAIQRITAQYLQEAPARLAEIHTALARHDATTLARAAHSLKSTSRYVHAAALSELGAEIERLADTGQLTDIASLADCADKEFADLSIRLEPLNPPS